MLDDGKRRNEHEMEGGDMPILIISREHGIVENGNQGVWQWIKRKRRQDESQNETDGQEQSHTEQDQVWVVTTAGPRSRGLLNNGSGTGGDRPRELPHAEGLWANGLTFRRYENATVSGGQIVGSLYVAERTVQYFSRNSSRARFVRVLPVPLRLLLHALLAVVAGLVQWLSLSSGGTQGTVGTCYRLWGVMVHCCYCLPLDPFFFFNALEGNRVGEK